MIVVDTSVWVDLFCGQDTPEALLATELIEDDAGVALTDVVFGELLQGVADERQARALDRSLREFEILRLEELEDFRRGAKLYRTARARGITVRRTLDCLIASVCIREGVPILHADADFDRLASCTQLQVVPVVR